MVDRSTMLLVATCAMAVMAGGCGGEGEDRLSTSSLTKAQFVKRANTVCGDERAKVLTRIAAYQEEDGTPGGGEGTAAYDTMAEAVLLPTFNKELDAVTALGAPVGEEEKLEEIVSAQREAIYAAAERTTETYQEVERSFTRASELMWDYGLSRCMVSGPPEGDRGGESRGAA